MGIKSRAKEKVKGLKNVKSRFKEGAAALAGVERDEDEESIFQKKQDKAEGEKGKVAKSGNGLPKLMMSEPGRQAFWFLILLLSLLSCQAGLVFSFLGVTLRPTLENHEVMMNHYGQLQATLNVGRAGSFIVIVGLMMVKGSAFQLVAALLARQKRKSRRRCAVKIAFGCVVFEVVFIVLMCVVTTLFSVWLEEFHATYRATFPRALVSGYLRNVSITAYVNWLQFRFQCCGVTDYKDWFIADWHDRQWLANRYPTVLYYRDKFYATGKKVERYPDWREMSLMTNYERSTATRLAFLQDRAKRLVGDSLIDEYVAMTSFGEVPFSCCRPDSASTWCTRQYLVFKLYEYDFKVNATIFKRGCPKQVEAYINSRLTGLGTALVVLIVVRLLNLVTLRLVQTSTFNALVARRHLSQAHGWLLTTRRATVVVPSSEERHLLQKELISDVSPSDEPDSWPDEEPESWPDEEPESWPDEEPDGGELPDQTGDEAGSENSGGGGWETKSAASGTTEPSDGDADGDGDRDGDADADSDADADRETVGDLTEISTVLAPSDASYG